MLDVVDIYERLIYMTLDWSVGHAAAAAQTSSFSVHRFSQPLCS